MKIACLLLLQYFDPGFNADTIQYKTMRGLRSHYSNLVHSAGRSPVRLDQRDICLLHAGLSLQDGRRLDVRAVADDDEVLRGWVLQEEDWAILVIDTTGLLHTALTGFQPEGWILWRLTRRGDPSA